MNRIDDFLGSLEEAFARAGDKDSWPMHVAAVAPYFGDIEAADLFAKTRQLAAENTPIDEVKQLFVGPSTTRSCLFDLIVGLKETDPPLAPDERVWFVEYMFDVIEGMVHGDMLCRDGKIDRMASDFFEVVRAFVHGKMIIILADVGVVVVTLPRIHVIVLFAPVFSDIDKITPHLDGCPPLPVEGSHRGKMIRMIPRLPRPQEIAILNPFILFKIRVDIVALIMHAKTGIPDQEILVDIG